MNRFLILIISLFYILPGIAGAQAQYRETVWLQLNRDIYLSGEEIEYTISLLENDTYKPSVLSKNIRIEFTDSKGNSLIKENIELTDSKASGSIGIPSNLESGWYLLRSYTNWMRNFPGSEFSDHHIRVLNPEDIDQDSIVTNNNILRIKVQPITNPKEPNLLRCGIYTSNEFGEGVGSEGIVLSGPGDTVMTFHTNNTGWGTSYYRPSDPDRYQVFALGYSKDNISMDIVDARNKGVNATYSEKSGYISIDLAGLDTGSSYKALVHKMYSWSWFRTVKAENEKAMFRIPIRDLSSGVSQISILDKDNKVIFRHIWSDYKEKSATVLIEKGSLPGQTAYEQIFEYYAGGDFDPSGVNSLYILADRYIESSTINNYLPGLPGWPAKYDIPSASDAFDAWISCSCYPDKVAEAFFTQNQDYPETSLGISTFEYPPETRGGILRGIVYRNDNKEPVVNTYLALTILNDNSHFAASTDERGNFIFTFPDQRGQRDYLINFIEEYDPSWIIEFTDDYDSYIPVLKKRGFAFTPEELSFLRYQKLNSDLKKIYYIEEEAIIPGDSLPVKGAFYGTPDISVKVDDYIQLPNLREVIYEVVPYVNIKQHRKKYEIQVAGEFLFSSEYPTLILMDGIPIYNYQELLNLPPERIDLIEAVTAFYIHGNTVFEGIVNIKSVNNDFGGLTMPSSTVLSTLSLPVKKHYYPIERNMSELKGMPDLDQILKWDTREQSSNSSVGVYLNNNPGKYRILIYGFDNDGKWYNGKLIFNVPESSLF
ncbi:MAG: hypothetical protein QNK33_00615 [Bacteroidales bacterium]|nr:hypothetical protein [Bacteroidales bacterium]